MGRFSAKFKERDYLKFRFNEIENLNPSAKDYHELEEFVTNAQLGLQESKTLTRVQEILDSGFSGRPLSSALSESSKLLEKLKKRQESVIDSLSQMTSDAASVLDELSYELGRYLADLEVDDAGFARAQERLGAYKDLIRKLSVSDVEALEGEYKRIDDELVFVEQGENELRRLLKSLDATTNRLIVLADKITLLRKQAFTQIKQKVEAELSELNMKGARLELEFSSASSQVLELDFPAVLLDLRKDWEEFSQKLATLSRYGKDKPQFLLAANPGEPAKALAKVASGGELSRIMLGIKKNLILRCPELRNGI